MTGRVNRFFMLVLVAVASVTIPLQPGVAHGGPTLQGDDALEPGELFRSGVERYRSGEYREAIEYFTRTVEVEPRHGPAKRYLRRSRAVLERREREEEIAEQRRLEAARQEREDELYAAGMERYRGGDYAGALEYFERLLEKNPGRRDAARQAGRSRAVLERQEKEEELAEQRRLAAEAREREDGLYASGMERYRGGDYAGALEYFERLLEKNPGRRDAARQAGRSRAVLERREKEEELAEQRRLEAARQERADEMFEEGLARFEEGEYGEALKVFDEALLVDPSHAESRRYAKASRLRIEREERARRREEALAASRARVEAYRAAKSEAVLTSEELADAREEEISAIIKEGLGHFRKGEYEESIIWFSKAFEIIPDHLPAQRYLELAEIRLEEAERERIAELERTGFREERRRAREETAELRAKEARERRIAGILERGDSYYGAQRFEAAVRHWETGLRIDPEHPVLLSKIRGAENEIRRREEVERNERAAFALLADGNRFFKNKEYGRAVSAWKRVLELLPKDHPDYQRASGALHAAKMAEIRVQQRTAAAGKDLTERTAILGVQEAWMHGERVRPPTERITRPEDPVRIRRPLSERARLRIEEVNFKDMHIRDVARYLVQMSDVNIVLDESIFDAAGLLPGGISPEVTVELRDIPLINALEIILRAKRLVYRLEENIIWITTPERIEQERLVTKVYTLLSPDVGLVRFPEAALEREFDLEAMMELQRLEDDEEDPGFVRVETVISTLRNVVAWPEGSFISFHEGTATLIIRNTPSNLRILESIIRMLEEPPGQVAIQSRFITITVNELREISSQFPDILLGLGERGDLSISRPGQSYGISLPGTEGRTLGIGYDRLAPTEFSVLLDLIESKTNANILQAPKILTRNLQDAELKVVHEYRFPEDYQVYSFIEFVGQVPVQRTRSVPVRLGDPVQPGVSLYVVRPDISPDMRTITLRIMPSISQYMGMETFGDDEDVVDIPQFKRKRMDTYVTVGDGETVVMGGLIEEVSRDRVRKVPVLGDIPLIGRLFRTVTQGTEKECLLIFITTDLITPAGEKYRELP